MKIASIILINALFCICYQTKAQTMDTTKFKAEKVTRTAVITLNGSMKAVFPLFGAFEERKWTTGWNPTLIYPVTETIEEGTTFKTQSRGHGETEFIWRVTRYETAQHLIQYLITSENRYWTITVKCKIVSETQTSAEITYTFIGLNEKGNQLNREHLKLMYAQDLKDWKADIDVYLEKGKTQTHH